jgi:hypothetical protein
MARSLLSHFCIKTPGQGKASEASERVKSPIQPSQKPLSGREGVAILPHLQYFLIVGFLRGK